MAILSIASSSADATIDNKSIHVLLGDTRNAPYSETAPGSVLSTFNAAVLGQLIKHDKNFELMPSLLEGWNWDYKESEYVLKLKPNLIFHNSRAITAKDLEFSLLRGFFSKHQSFYRTYLSNVLGTDQIIPGTPYTPGRVSGVRVVDSLTVRVKLKAPNPSFLLGLTGPYFSLVPIEALNADLITWKQSPVGAGPYKVKAAFKNGVTHIAAVKEMHPHPTNVYLHTEVTDQVYDISIFKSDRLNHAAYRSFIGETAASVLNIAFSNIRDDAKKIEFRMMISNMINKKNLFHRLPEFTVAEEMLPGHLWGRTGLTHQVDRNTALEALDKYFPDLKKDGLRLSVFSGPTLSISKQIIVSELKRQFQEFGITLHVETSINKFIAHDEAARCQLFLSGMVSDYIDPLVMFASLTKRGADQYTRASTDEKLEQLYMQASQNAQRDERIQSLRKLSEYVSKNVYVLPLGEEKPSILYSAKTIKSLGAQHQPLTLFLDKVELQ